MAYELDPEEQELVDAVSRIGAEVLAPQAAAADEQGRLSEEVLGTLAEVGVLGMNLPEQYGGPGIGSVAMSQLVAAITESCASTASIITAHFLATDSILLGGTAEQRERWLPRAAAGEVLGAFGLTEPGAGSNPAEMSTRATRVDGGWHIRGGKCFITNAGFADFIIVYAVTDGTAKHAGISAFLLDVASAPGLVFNPPERTMGLRGSPVYEFAIDTVVPESALLGGEGEGFRTAMRVLDRGRIEVAAMSLGICRAALTAAVAWAEQRKISGRPLNRLQGIAFKFADMYTRYRSAWLLTMDAAEQRDAGTDFTLSSATAKLAASEAAAFVADEALQVHGGYGFTKDLPLERYVRDARIYRIYEGSSEIQRMIIARNLSV